MKRLCKIGEHVILLGEIWGCRLQVAGNSELRFRQADFDRLNHPAVNLQQNRTLGLILRINQPNYFFQSQRINFIKLSDKFLLRDILLCSPDSFYKPPQVSRKQ